MNYPESIEIKLGFDQIRSLIEKECLSGLGKDYLKKMKFSNKHSLIFLWQNQVKEFLSIINKGIYFPSDNYIDPGNNLKNLEIEGFFLLEHQIFELRLSLETISKIMKFLKENALEFPLLADIFKDYEFEKGLIAIIDKVLDKEGKIKANASVNLQKITASLMDTESEVHKKINQIFKNAKKEGWAADIDISIRDGRLVMPILAEHKRKIKGLVHDESANGTIYFIEPAEILDLNNFIRELQLAKRKEIELILKSLSQQIRPFVPLLQTYFQKLGLIDFIRAKAYFAQSINAEIPHIENKPAINWKKAFHPLLWLHHKKNKQKIIPLDLEFNDKERILVISGPNAGGKSVSLKTIGLLQYMLQCGIPCPALPESKAGIFKEMFIDIGDDQDLDNDLSTYSSHLKNMDYFVKFSGGSTLFLIDEFGTGTDPQYGGPLAESILEALNKKMSYGIVTTHFSNLKVLANQTEGLVNASMAYDTENLVPLFRLEKGKPGSSFAFEVAEKIGLNKNILQSARKKVGKKQQNVDDLIVNLEKEKNEVSELKEKLNEKEIHLNKLIEDYSSLKSQIEDKKKSIIESAKQKAIDIIKDSNSLIEETIRTIKEEKADNEKTKIQRQKIKETKEILEKEIKPIKVVETKDLEALKPGDLIKFKDSDNIGEIISILKNKAIVAIGDIRTTATLNQLEKISATKAKKQLKKAVGYDFNEKMAEFSSEIDVRGQRAEEALSAVIKLLDQAVILGFEHIRIVHGKGNGILRKYLRDHLKKYKFISSMADEHADRGGDGITLVTLK